MKKIILAATMSAFLFTGCATQTGLVGSSVTSTAATPAKVETQKFYFWGLGQEKSMNAAQICGSASKVDRVQSSWEPLDILLSAITAGIYYPRTATVFCK